MLNPRLGKYPKTEINTKLNDSMLDYRMKMTESQLVYADEYGETRIWEFGS